MTQNDTRDAGTVPEGWVWTTLERVCLPPQYGWTTSASEEGVLRLLRTTDITSGKVDWDSVPFCRDEPPAPEKYLLHDGDIVISRAGSVGYSFLVRNPTRAVFASYLIRFRPLVNEQYVAYFLQTPSYWQSISEKKLGIAIPNVNASKLKQILFPLAPLPEQHRIVAEIETQFTRLEAGVAALERAQANLRRYKAAVLKAACEGRLVPTEAELARAKGRDYEPADALLRRILAERRAQWEAENLGKKYKEPTLPDTSDLPALPEGWVWASFDQLLVELKNGYFGGRPSTEPPGIPILRISAVRPMLISFADLRYLPEVDSEKIAVYQVEQGDLLFTRYNGNLHLVGACGLVRQTNIPMLYPDKLIRVRVIKKLFQPAYAEAFFATEIARVLIESRAKTTAGQYGIAGGELKQIPVAVPPLLEQHRIVAEVERRLSVVAELEKEVELALRRAARLRQAILKRAFEGRLVPQDPADEPASALLARIRAGQSANEPASKKPRQMSLPMP